MERKADVSRQTENAAFGEPPPNPAPKAFQIKTIYEFLPNWSQAQKKSVNTKHHCCLHQRYNHTPSLCKSHSPGSCWRASGGPGHYFSLGRPESRQEVWAGVSDLQHDKASQTQTS